MARIRATRQPALTRIVVEGRLRATDMRRLEQACAAALESPQLQLVLDLTRATEVDGVAAAHLRHMVVRGAVIKRQE
jgi:hypothetical protein